MEPDPREWLEADGLGGYAMGTAGGVRTRRYHALLVAATDGPARRMVLVNGAEVHVEGAGGRRALSTQRYRGGVLHPDGVGRISAFGVSPWPTWTYALEDGTRVEHELLVAPGAARTWLRWRRTAGAGPLRLEVRPLLSGRDHHALHHENPAFRFEGEAVPGGVRWRPYPGVPAVEARGNGVWRAAPDWYRGFLYAEEEARGLDAVEDLAAPGAFTFDLAEGPAVLALSAGGAPAAGFDAAAAERVAGAERARRAGFASPLHRAADAYLVRRGAGRTVVAGYPWFTDWGRDTFVALRGLCLAAGRAAEAGEIVATWAGALSEGMLPNRFPEAGGAPEFNSVDATLWFVVAAGEVLRAGGLGAARAGAVREAILAAVAAYAAGARFGIRVDADGLLACGGPGTQLTWMDARVDGVPVTGRAGKPVEVQALWVNALAVAAALDGRWRGPLERAEAAFGARFWDPAAGALADVVDCDHRPGVVDRSFRPNQLLAAGGLPRSLLDPGRARQVVDAVERRLWTPLGLRSLAPDDPRYAGRYRGSPARRDAAYHQGTAWPWLAGPFVEAWIRARGGGAAARAEAGRRFVEPLLARARQGFGHLPELADGDPPHAPGGCPFQAWSVGAALQAARAVDGGEPGEGRDAGEDREAGEAGQRGGGAP